MAENYNNYVFSTISTGGGINNSVTTFDLADGTGFPTSNFRILVESELMFVGSRSGTTLSSVTRGVEGTSAVSHAQGTQVDHVLTAAALTAINNDLNVASKAKMRRATAQSIPTGASTKILFDTVEFDIGADITADAVTNDRFDINTTGYYLIHCSWRSTDLLSPQAQQVDIQVNSSSVKISELRSSNSLGDFTIEVIDMRLLTSGDFVEMFVLQADGAAMNTQTALNSQPAMFLFRIF